MSSSGYSVFLKGVEMGCVTAPVHSVHLRSQLVNGVFNVAVCDRLPVEGITLLLGNDLAGGRVNPSLEVLDDPVAHSESPNQADLITYPACAVTCAQARKDVDITLRDTVLMQDLLEDSVDKTLTNDLPCVAEESDGTTPDHLQDDRLPLTHETLSLAQKEDQSLKPFFEQVTSENVVDKDSSGFMLENGVLIRCWPNPVSEGADWGITRQIVVPQALRQKVISMAHSSDWSGHLGVNKTYHSLLQHFFWPGMKKQVAMFCKECHVCQMVGKPNQVIHPAPLHPLPVVITPFDHVIVDCVGPLPPSKTGKRYLLTIMCVATRFPEAVPLSSITTKAVIKALTTFFSVFGLPRILQTDQGTNFQSRVFNQVAKTLGITHVISSAYHPESQGALERWHQTLKSMLTKYCLSTDRTWEEGLPFVLFAAREAVQDSLGFSPAQLVFGHTPRGPLKALKEWFLSSSSQAGVIASKYVSAFQKRLQEANAIARQHLAVAKRNMKANFDKKAKRREFHVGDKVLVLLPLSGSSLTSKFEGPFEIIQKLSDTDYVLKTPTRRRKTRKCHVNMIKLYHSRPETSTKDVGAAVVTPACGSVAEKDELGGVFPQYSSPRLNNSEALQALPTQLSHLPSDMKEDLLQLISDNKCLFSDVPKQTTLTAHEVEVSCAKPLKQHPYRTSPQNDR
uniref:Gypsy retrotransposon integrase-like protein 1 n=1 Tax=Nothobranchius furzeri TaxID=105023 RepID=A0A8C6LM93_NOTFU